jgi:gliding motility-associated-like protein
MNLTDTLAGGPQTFTWTFQGGAPATSTVANPTICYNLPGKYDVILRVSNPYPISLGGSSGIAPGADFITVVDIPNVTIVPPGQSRSTQTINFGGSAVLSGSGAFSYVWDPPYNISSLTSPVVTVSPLQTTQYVLWGYNSANCFSRDSVDVYVIMDCGEMFVPNAFSPNGDGHNDELKVMGICLESMVFMVFNRWGEKIFESTDQSKGWDGTYKERPVETGVYVYRLEGKTYDGKGFSEKGNVTLIR